MKKILSIYYCFFFQNNRLHFKLHFRKPLNETGMMILFIYIYKQICVYNVNYIVCNTLNKYAILIFMHHFCCTLFSYKHTNYNHIKIKNTTFRQDQSDLCLLWYLILVHTFTFIFINF